MQYRKNNDADDDSHKGYNILQENGMQVAVQGVEDDTEWVNDAHANNEYVEPEDPHLDEFEDNG